MTEVLSKILAENNLTPFPAFSIHTVSFSYTGHHSPVITVAKVAWTPSYGLFCSPYVKFRCLFVFVILYQNDSEHGSSIFVTDDVGT